MVSFRIHNVGMGIVFPDRPIREEGALFKIVDCQGSLVFRVPLFPLEKVGFGHLEQGVIRQG